MRKYAVLSPRFWIGDTGKELRKYGDVQRIALYLLSCPDSNMIGLYYLSIPTLCHELNIKPQGASKGLLILNNLQYAAYDTVSETVFVYEMVRFQVGESLKPTDKRVAGIDKELQQYVKSPFYNLFIRKYKDRFNLSSEEIPENEKGLARGIIQEQEQEQEQVQDQEHDQNQDQPNLPEIESTYSEAFLQFWKEYPNKVGKDGAWNSWQKKKLNSVIDEILKSIETYKNSETVRKGFIKNPQTWINQGCWKDEATLFSTKTPTGRPRTVAIEGDDYL
jgi:hypothetical protein